MGLSVLLLSRYERIGPSSRVRHYNYLPSLKRAGIEVTIAPQLGEDYLRRMYAGHARSTLAMLKAYGRRLRQILAARQYDLVWIEKEALPWMPAALERIILGNRPIIIDFDDAWYLRYSQHRNPIVRYFLGDKFDRLLSDAAMITTGSANLTKWAEAFATEHVVQIPSTVDTDKYSIRPLPEQPFTIGWIGTPSNVRYLKMISEALRHIQQVHGARVRLIGAADPKLPGVEVQFIPWREDVEAEELANCHVGVAPLADGPWEQGKCGYKVIQYMAAGRPVVASPVGENKCIIVPGKTGFFANGTEEWISGLTRLAVDRERNQRMGFAARERAEQMYSLRDHSKTIAQIMTSACVNSELKRAARKHREVGVLDETVLANRINIVPAK
jgi:glycosyltransferase involved in cell wall biosynthesis